MVLNVDELEKKEESVCTGTDEEVDDLYRYRLVAR
jgi:hypothetical protein